MTGFGFGKGPPLTDEQRAVHDIRADETMALHARIAELELAAKWEGDLAQQALDDLKKRDARIAELEAALKQSARVEASLASRIANLMDALEPFADVKVYPVLEDTTRVYDEPITYGDIRAAAAALKKTNDGER